jgi:hypothetical protein
MCSAGVAKCFLIVFNSIFFLLGGAVLGLGIFVLLDESTILSVFSRIPGAEQTVSQALSGTSILEKSSYMLIAGGGFVFIIGFLGCCGACCKNNCLLYMYAFFVFLIISCEVTAGVLGFLNKNEIDTRLGGFLNDTITDYYDGSIGIQNNVAYVSSQQPVSLAWDTAMVGLSCCGANSHTDFVSMATKWNRTYSLNVGGSLVNYNAVVPPSCCKIVDKTKFPADIPGITFTDLEGCITAASDVGTNKLNCKDKIQNLFYQYMYYVIGAGIGIGVIEIIAVVAACVLIRSNKKEDVY